MAAWNWPLGNGTSLEFIIYGPNTTWHDVAGLYIFARHDILTLGWRAIYVGQTHSFSSRPAYHDRWKEALENGATHIHAKVVRQEANRDRWERMLIEHLDPPLNKQLRFPPPFLDMLFPTR